MGLVMDQTCSCGRASSLKGSPEKRRGSRTWGLGYRAAKRSLDIVAAVTGLVLTLPLLLLLALAIRLEGKGPVFFRQERLGKGFRPFRIWKFRTMATRSGHVTRGFTPASDQAITRLGGLLRGSKLDEIPQLLNVLRGEMSCVGPRPEVALHVQSFRSDYEELLQVRPGVTGLASIRYRGEGELLARAANPELEYTQVILPEKIRFGKEYIASASLLFDFRIVLATVGVLLREMLSAIGHAGWTLLTGQAGRPAVSRPLDGERLGGRSPEKASR